VFGHPALSRWATVATPDIEGYPSRAWKVWIIALPVIWMVYRSLLHKIIGFAGESG